MMNEKIREFAVEAKLGQIYNGTQHSKLIGKFFPNLSGPTNEELEKFAELIITECATIARRHNLEKAERSYMIHKAINQHFGM